MELKSHLELARKLAAEAGAEILKLYKKNIDVEYKDDRSPVTEADKLANGIIVKGLAAAFPEMAILAEESKDNRSRLDNDWCWIVDPLDGTKEYINRTDEFTVNIALSFQHRTVLGVVYVPVTAETYFAALGQGAYRDKDGDIKAIKVSDRQKELRMVVSRSHLSDQDKKMMEDPRVSDTQACGSSLKGCVVAAGEADIYFRSGYTMEWDTAAMQCVVEEAGGIFRQMDDSEMLYNREDSLNRKGFYVLNRKENRLLL